MKYKNRLIALKSLTKANDKCRELLLNLNSDQLYETRVVGELMDIIADLADIIHMEGK